MSERIQLVARDAQIGQQYKTELGKVVTVVSINRFGENPEDVSGVVVKSAEMVNAVPISGGTILYVISEQERSELEAAKAAKDAATTDSTSPEPGSKPKKEKKEKVPKEKKEKVPKEPKEKKPKMSHIMNPMIFAGESPEKIADAVIAVFPEQAERRAELIGLIKGPRTYNLKQKFPEKFGLPAKETPTEETPTEDAPGVPDDLPTTNGSQS